LDGLVLLLPKIREAVNFRKSSEKSLLLYLRLELPGLNRGKRNLGAMRRTDNMPQVATRVHQHAHISQHTHTTLYGELGFCAARLHSMTAEF
jgi:hypothetical protein